MLTTQVAIYNHEGSRLHPMSYSIIGDSEDDLLIASLTYVSGHTEYSYIKKMTLEKGKLELFLESSTFPVDMRVYNES